MVLSLSFLEQYFEDKLIGKDVNEHLTMLGLEVETHEIKGDNVKNVVVGKILKIEAHPDADKLVVCQVDVGEEVVQIVTGAPNVYEGMHCPCALVGGEVVFGKIKKSKLRGVDSLGMMCSLEELGVHKDLLSEEEKNGIYDLGDQYKLGTNIKAIVGVNDEIIEIAITPNRGDCYGLYNVAKELKIALDIKLKDIEVKEGILSDEFQINISRNEETDENICNRFVGRIINDVKIFESPLWFQNILRSVGIKPINNMVDITNYVMFELGHPMHSYDLSKLEGNELNVELGREGQNVVTLDGQERELPENTIIIKDGKKTVALGGVMGLLNSVIDDDTKSVFLEAASFNPKYIRRASRKLGLRSEASTRFERGVSEENLTLAINRACYLIEKIGAGKVSDVYFDNYYKKQEINEIKCNIKRVSEVLGVTIPKEEIVNIFKNLYFVVEDLGEELVVTPPPHRRDINIFEDLVEEVIRIYGYHKMPATLPTISTNTLETNKRILIKEEVKDIMKSLGAYEIVNLSFINENVFDEMGFPENAHVRDTVKVLNPLSEKNNQMRTVLIPGILENASRNYKRQQRDIFTFEVGNVFHKDDVNKDSLLPIEELRVGAFITVEDKKLWYGEEVIDFFTIKGMFEELLEELGIDISVLTYDRTTNSKTYHPSRSASVFINDDLVAYIGQLHPTLLAEKDINNEAFYFELNLDKLPEKKSIKVKELPKFPSVTRDLSFVIPNNITSKQVESIFRKTCRDQVSKYKLFDLYEGVHIEEGYKSMAYSITYQNMERTLKIEEVELLHSSILDALVLELGAKLR